MLLSINIIWLWLAVLVVPDLENMVFNLESRNDPALREAFSSMHLQSQRLSLIGLGITMILPWFSGISIMGMAASAK